MKKLILLLAVAIMSIQAYAQDCGSSTVTSSLKPTSIGLIIYSNDSETVFNAMRFANYAKNQGDTVSIFLLGKGVEVDKLAETDNEVKDQVDTFLKNDGLIFGCGTCLQKRNNNEPQYCKFSSMSDLYDLVRKNKITLTF